MNKMKAVVTSAALMACALAPAARAEAPAEVKTYPSKEESVGLIGGAGIGALAGGPLGLVVGMALGGWIGDRMDTHKRTTRELERELAAARRQAAQLDAKLAASDRAIETLSLQLKASRERWAQVNERS